jgi:putative transposase
MAVLCRKCVLRGRGRRVLRDLATIVTPDTILRWHRQVIARKSARGPTSDPYGTPRHLKEIEHLTGRMANEHSRWDATRIQGALRNLGHGVARSTIANILKSTGSSPPRPAVVVADVRGAQWGAIAAANFLTTDVWTRRGLVTYDSPFVIDLASRRVGRWLAASRRVLALLLPSGLTSVLNPIIQSPKFSDSTG